MNLLLVIGLCVVAVAAVIAAIRRLLGKKSKELSEQMATIIPFSETRNGGQDISKRSGEYCIANLRTDLQTSFSGHVITSAEGEMFAEHYSDFYNKVKSLQKFFDIFRVEPTEAIKDFAYDFENIHSLVHRHNEQVIQNILDTQKIFLTIALNIRWTHNKGVPLFRKRIIAW